MYILILQGGGSTHAPPTILVIRVIYSINIKWWFNDDGRVPVPRTIADLALETCLKLQFFFERNTGSLGMSQCMQ